MQAARISLGKSYAVNRNGELAIFRVTEIVTTKNLHKTTNVFRGYIEGSDDGEGGRLELAYQAADILDEAEKYQQLMDERARRDAAIKAERQAEEDKKNHAATLLAKAIGVPLYTGKTKFGTKDYEAERRIMDGPHIKANYSTIEIVEKAHDQLIAFLEGVAKERAFFKGSETSLDIEVRRERDLADQTAREVKEESSLS